MRVLVKDEGPRRQTEKGDAVPVSEGRWEGKSVGWKLAVAVWQRKPDGRMKSPLAETPSPKA
jgi:hypothetical protein